MIDLYDEELPRVGKVAFEMNKLWKETARHIDIANPKETARRVNEYHKKCVDEFEKAGFVVEVDTSPIYADMPPVISIVDRVNKVLFDHDKKAWEVKKSKERGGK